MRCSPLVRIKRSGSGMPAVKSEAENRHFSQALSPLRQAVQMRPTNLDARLDLANAYLLLNQPQEAAKEAQQALAIDPNSAAAFTISRSGRPWRTRVSA